MDDQEAIQALDEVYGGDLKQLDVLVGLMAEKKIKGFAISETAFVIFLLMASSCPISTSNFYNKKRSRFYPKKEQPQTITRLIKIGKKLYRW
ncbi:Alpha-dioxygenase 1 [Morella rubra]|uniref:Alpha-dioxygenase 1 n=1 Tax=Morella rubra TaxID=262757 RepID=A0A6A1VIM8_9ROSI|nr:Alpha-dioxygenase 1 [Morella rubra]